MKTKFSLIIIAFLFVSIAFAQTNLNSYKYVIVPNKYAFLKQKDQYQLNSLTQFLFNKYGFQALMEGDNYPEELIRNRCLALKSDVIKDSGMFKTKLGIELKDCNDIVVYTSRLGESREKDYKAAYTEALRDAFKEIEVLNYDYKPDANLISANSQDILVQNENTKEIEQLKAEIESLKQKNETPVVGVVGLKAPAVAVIPVVQAPAKEIKKAEGAVKEVSSGVLYAQEIENGFQLVDSSPKVVYKIKKTSIADVFLVENQNATLYKNDEKWILEYYENDVLKQKELHIKF